MKVGRVVNPAQWREERIALLAKEKALLRERDALSAERRELPWVLVEEEYVFDSKEGKKTFAELFDGLNQLVVYHLMFAPDWENPCKSCSFWADQFERNVVHLRARDISMVAISRASVDQIEAMKARVGWTFPWYSSGRSSFNYDYGVSFKEEDFAAVDYNYRTIEMDITDMPGVSVFVKGDDGRIYHTYSTYGRGLDNLNSAYQFIDLTPKGRDEPPDSGMQWLRIRDMY